MLWTILSRLLNKEISVPLGRWGNHWEKRMRYQTYYD